jgi:hypothetical protein
VLAINNSSTAPDSPASSHIVPEEVLAGSHNQALAGVEDNLHIVVEEAYDFMS